MKIMSKKFKIKTIVQNCPLNRYQLFKNLNSNADLKNTNDFFDNMISWPFYTYMSQNNFNYMIRKTQQTLNIIRSRFND